MAALIIRKVLNNNTAIVISNDQSQEVIVMGKGIAFHRKPGEEIDPSNVEKTFSLTTTDPEITRKFQQILSSVPMAHLMIAEEVIEYAKHRIGSLDDCIYITLSDHIHSAIERYARGVMLKNPLTMDIRRLYKAEFQIGEEAARIVNEKMKIAFLDDEKAFIAMHFVNAKLNSASYKMDDIYTITRIIQEILDLVSGYFQFTFNLDSLSYFRFVTHLKFFAQRLINETDEKETTGDEDLFSMIQKKYANSFRCVQKIQRFLVYKYHYTIGHEEMTYLTIHIERIVRDLT